MAARIKMILCFLYMLVAGFFFVQYSDAAVHTVKDMAGRTLVLPQKVERVVGLGGALRFLVYLDAVDMVAGVENIEKDPSTRYSRPYSLAVEKVAAGLPSIAEGGPGGRLPNFEKLIELKPDVIFIMGFDKSQADIIQKKTGIPVIFLSYGDTGLFRKESAFEALRIMGSIINRADRAKKVIDFINQSENDIRKRTEGIKPKSVYVGAISFKGRHGITSTQGFYTPFEWLGVKNVVNKTATHGQVFIDREMLLVWNPDYIFIDSSGLDMVEDDYRKNSFFYKKLEAVKQGKILSVMPYNSYHTNIELMIANSYFIGKMLYPERFSDIDPFKKADEIASFFTGLRMLERMQKNLKVFKKLYFADNYIEAK
ncbi:MAG: iron ABC transporter substrate-binding protein [Dissulfurispiraceae bacterium]|jgi:iron complex transport system substrate-binding protein|nr:iron ABC transporter substrate-binding protein [Dissulfurispiraceae bacterium]